MSLFDKLFGSAEGAKEEKVLPWIPLTDVSQLAVIEDASKTKTQLIFKHSTRCSISRMVLNQFVENYTFSEEDFDLYYLDLLNYRGVSNDVAAKFQVYHESPQLLVIKNGVVVAHESHGAINGMDLSTRL